MNILELRKKLGISFSVPPNMQIEWWEDHKCRPLKMGKYRTDPLIKYFYWWYQFISLHRWPIQRGDWGKFNEGIICKNASKKMKLLGLVITSIHLDLMEQGAPEGCCCFLDLARPVVQGDNSELSFPTCSIPFRFLPASLDNKFHSSSFVLPMVLFYKN